MKRDAKNLCFFVLFDREDEELLKKWKLKWMGIHGRGAIKRRLVHLLREDLKNGVSE